MTSDKHPRAPSAEGRPVVSRWQRRLAVRGSRRARLGIIAGIAGGALVAFAAFLPWLEFNGRVRSGWEIYDLYAGLDLNPAVISPLFGAGDYDIFFTGLLTLSLGVFSMLLTAWALVIDTKAPGTKTVLRRVLTVCASVAIATALVLTAVNLRTVRLGSLGFQQSPIHYGLWVTFAGALAGTIGMALSAIPKRHTVPRQELSAASQPRAASAPAAASEPATEMASSEPATEPALTAPQPAVSASTGPATAGSAKPAQSRSRPGRKPARALAIVLFLVGIGGFVVANAADRSHAPTAVQDVAVLGQQNPVGAAQALRAQIRPVKRSFDTYAAASGAVAATRADVTNLFNALDPPSAVGSPEAVAARLRLSAGIAAYGAAVEREQVARITYDTRLELLLRQVHR